MTTISAGATASLLAALMVTSTREGRSAGTCALDQATRTGSLRDQPRHATAHVSQPTPIVPSDGSAHPA